jgi:hypothetical protein
MVSSLVLLVLFGANAVPDTGNSGDDPGCAETLTQRRDGNADCVGERVCVLIPGALQEFLGADDTAFGRDENLKHGELLASKGDIASVAVDLAAEWIEP